MGATFNIEEERLRQEILKRKAKLVLIQLPNGLKPKALEIESIVRSAGALPIISADPCYGACDLALAEAKSLEADVIVHYGHTPMLSRVDAPVIYVEARAKVDVKEVIAEALTLLSKSSRIGLLATVQYVNALDEVKEFLLKAGKTVVVGNSGRLPYGGQVIGCDYSNATSISQEVDAFLMICGGRFHAIGVRLATGKLTVVADPYEGRAYLVEGEARRVLKQRWASITEAKGAEVFGVIIGLKPGQMRIKRALEVKRRIEEKGRRAVLLAVKEVTPEGLEQFQGIDAFVNTTCPRLSLDDAPRFRRPILTANEALVALGEMKWEELLSKGGWFESEI